MKENPSPLNEVELAIPVPGEKEIMDIHRNGC